MAIIPTYWYLGDDQINGGFQSGVYPITGAPVLWGYQLNQPRFTRVVPSGADGVSGGAFSPYWDGQHTAGAGKFVKYAHTGSPLPEDAGAVGDNWYVPGGGGVSPCTMLMNALWERHQSAPGFKLLKYATQGGFGTGSEPLKPGAAGWNKVMTEWAKMQAAVAPGDTLRLDAVILDASATDIRLGNFTYKQDIQATIDGIRAIAPDCLIVLVHHRAEIYKNTSPSLGALARVFNLELLKTNTNMRLFDMNWAQWGSDSPFLNFTEGPDNVNYRVQDIIEAGTRLGRIVDAFFQPVPEEGTSIPVVVMLADSQGVCLGADPQFVILTNQQTLLGNLGGGTGSDQESGKIWNDVQEQVQPYDVVANANTFGETLGWFGFEASLLAGLRKKFPAGVAVFKFAKVGASMTIGAQVLAGPASVGCFDKLGESLFPLWRTSWAKFRLALQRDLGLTADTIAICTSVGGNDTANTQIASEFAEALTRHVDDVRELVGTRTHGKPTPYVILQPPPHESTGAEFSTPHGNQDALASVRQTIASLPTLRDNVRVVLNDGTKYELLRFERVHYSAPAVLSIGYDVAAQILAAIESEEGETLVTTGGLPSETAAFVVEDGSGLTSANALVTTEFVSQYAAEYGNPVAWRDATPARQRDCIRQATRWVSYRYRYRGQKVHLDQALPFPRHGLYDDEGLLVDHETIPTRVAQAVAEAAIRICAGSWSPFPDEAPAYSGSESISVGPISLSGGSGGGGITETRLAVVERLLGPFIRRAQGSISR